MGIIEILDQGCIDSSKSFLVIGGYAVNAYGYPRVTYDLDFLTSKAQRDYWKELLLNNGYSLYTEREAFMQFTPVAAEQMAIDFMTVNETTYAKLHAGAVDSLLGGVKVRVPKLFHLIALKLHVVKQELDHRKNKDLYDIFELVHINKVDVRSEEFKQLCEQFGNREIYETIVRARK